MHFVNFDCKIIQLATTYPRFEKSLEIPKPALSGFKIVFFFLLTTQVHVIELGPYKTGNYALRNSYDHLHFLDDLERYDFPIAVEVNVFKSVK